MSKFYIVLKNCLAGLYALMGDPAGTLCLLSLSLVGFLALHSKMGDVAAAACFTMIPAVAVLMKHKSFSGADIDSPPPTQQTIATVVENIRGQL